MKALLALILIPFLASSQSTAELDKKNGFKDLLFSQSAQRIIQQSAARKMPVKDDFYEYYQLNKKDYQNIGDFKVTSFMVKTKGEDSVLLFNMNGAGSTTEYRRMINYMTDLFGTPTTKSEREDHLLWNGQTTTLELLYDFSNETITVNIINKQLSEKVEAKRREQNRKTGL